MKIVIFGGEGFLGTKLKKVFKEKGHEVFSIDQKGNPEYKINVMKLSEIKNLLIKIKPEIIIDLIALTSSVECEKNPSLARKLNFESAKNISFISKKIGSKLFFFSSSYVFDGNKGNYSETDSPSPLGIYGKTKLEAEIELSERKNNFILRVDLLYGFNNKNSPNGIFEKILAGEEFFIGNPNQIRSPLFIDDVPKIIEKLYFDFEGGLFHVAGPDKIKMIDLLKKLESLVRKNTKIKIIEKESLLVPEKKDSSLSIQKINSLGIQTTLLGEALKIIKNEL